MTKQIMFQWNDRNHTMASIMRDIQNGTATIYRESMKGDKSTCIGLYLPNGYTMWILFTNSTFGNSPDWNPSYYQFTNASQDRVTVPDSRIALWNHGWLSAGNSHALASVYTQHYANMIDQNDGYWANLPWNKE